ncbi:MAG: Flp family type IVb pilin [Salinarimonadaceae bacterium]|nr:MAG: Flp family type IVb pilin [Salinarimonadaceae bacterium]
MTPLFRRFASDESGATAIEYALVASIVSVAIVASMTNLGSATINLYDFLIDNLVDPGGGD